jgi:hypothetical protein
MKSGDSPAATLSGNYRFNVGTSPINETDLVRLHFVEQKHTFAGVFGGGVKYLVSSRHGVRADVRVQVSRYSVETMVDATPSSVPAIPGTAVVSSTTPAIAFSNASAVRTSLSDPAFKDLKTFTGSGSEIHTSLTAGYFFRF